MKIINRINKDKQFISLEFFPPKERSEWPAFFMAVDRLAQINPLFASVTYGAGGSTHGDTLEIVTRLKREHGLEAMAHLTCVGADNDDMVRFLDKLADSEVDNVLALRGDLPQEVAGQQSISGVFQHTSDLVSFIRSCYSDMGIGVAGYPETHPEAENPESDMVFLKQKLDQGADLAITQLFFDNQIYFDFVRRAHAIGIDKLIIPGILPVVSLKVIRRITTLCGATIPADFLLELEEADLRGGSAAVQQLGIQFARKQAEELLAAGVPGIHIYTLNRADAVLDIAQGLLP